MANGGDVKVRITGDDKDLEKSLKGVEGKAKAALGGIGKVASATAKGVTAISAAMAAAGAAVMHIGGDFETAFAQVQTIMDVNQLGIEEMKEQILALSEATGVAASELSGSVYNAISATGDTANAVQLVEGATKLATAGFTDTESALGVITTAMNAYGLSAEEATRISDSLVQTQNLGVTTIAELSSSMGKAIASASAYGIDLGNVEAAYVSMTKSGISTAESTTYMSSMFKELGDSGSDVAKALKQQTGKSFSELMANGASLADVLGAVYKAAGQDSTALMNMWGSAEAGKAANAIINQGLHEFDANLASIQNSAGVTEAAYETMTNTVEHQTQMLKNTVQNLAIDIFDAYQPQIAGMISDANGWMSQLAEGFKSGGVEGLENAANEIAPQIVNALSSGINAAVGAVSGALPGLLNSLTGIAKNVIGGLGKTLPGLMTGLVSQLPSLIGSIGTLVPDVTTALFDALSAGIGALIPMLPELAMKIGEAFMNSLASVFVGLGSVMKSIIEALGGSVSEVVDGANGVLRKAFSEIETDKSKDYHLDLSPNVNVQEVSSGDLTKVTDMGKQAMDDIVKAYTDGIAGNDDSANAEFQQQIQETVDQALTEIESYRTNALTALDGAYEAGKISKTEYDAQAKEINATADAMISDVQTAAADMQAWGDAYANAATSTVQAHVGELEEAYGRIAGVEAQLNAIDEHVQRTTASLGEVYEKGVTSGQATDVDAVLTALTYEQDTLQKGLEDIESRRDETINKAVEGIDEDTKEFFDKRRETNDSLNQEGKDLATDSKDRMAAMWRAVGDAYLDGTDVLDTLDTTKASQHVLDMQEELQQSIQNAASSTDPAERKQAIIEALSGEGLTDADYQAIAKSMGVEDAGAGLQDAIAEALAGAFDSGNIQLGTEQLVDIFDNINEQAQMSAQEIFSQLPDELKTIIAEAINRGLVDGITDVDQITVEKLQEILTGAMGDAEKGLEDIESDPLHTTTTVENEIEVESTTTDGGTTEGVSGAVEKAKQEAQAELKDKSTGEPVHIVENATVDLEVTANISGTDFAGAGADAAVQFANGITSASGDATTAANTMANNAADATKVSTFSKGVDFAQGYARGIDAGANSAVNAAIRMATNALNAVKTAQASASPSKKTMALGRNFGEGYEVGIRESMQSAIETARSMTGEILNASTLTGGGLGVLRVEAGNDPLQVEMQGADRPILLDGVQISEIQAGNNSTSIAMNDRRYKRSVGG